MIAVGVLDPAVTHAVVAILQRVRGPGPRRDDKMIVGVDIVDVDIDPSELKLILRSLGQIKFDLIPANAGEFGRSSKRPSNLKPKCVPIVLKCPLEVSNTQDRHSGVKRRANCL